ncbi:MAG TPA: hypothetical protein VFQ35_26135 [Polyangiaceae bacterium]|nr:hypothetical protein [Polyangiaceae bacterium]
MISRVLPIVFVFGVGCGFGGRVELGDNGGAPPFLDDGSGGVAAGGVRASGGAAVSAQGGAVVLAQGGAAVSSGAGGAPSTSVAHPMLPMDATGEVPLSSNGYGIRGKWYAFSDEIDGGQTRIDGYGPGFVPFVPGRGMCIHGTTTSGLVDNWKTWGAGIGIALNVVDGTAETLVNPPPCYSLVISSDAEYPSELRADLNPTDDGTKQPANVELHAGSNDFCLSDAKTFAHCTPELDCLTPDSLNQGLAKINVVAATGTVSGPISFCIEALIPHD